MSNSTGVSIDSDVNSDLRILPKSLNLNGLVRKISSIRSNVTLVAGNNINFTQLSTDNDIVKIDAIVPEGSGGYPTTFVWNNGTTEGPTGSLTGVGINPVIFGAIPSASMSVSGIVTIGSQTFAGTKTFAKPIIGNLEGKATTAVTAEKVNKKLNLQINSGTTEGTDKFTFDGSAEKSLNIKAGSNITFASSEGTLTISATGGGGTGVYTAGEGLELVGTVFSHGITTTQSSVINTGRTYIQSIALDKFGHVTGISSATETGSGGPAGGNTGQLLIKNSDVDYDYKWRDETVTIVNSTDLPSVGDSEKLYVLKDENATYIWDANSESYSCVGNDYNEISVINGNCE